MHPRADSPAPPGSPGGGPAEAPVEFTLRAVVIGVLLGVVFGAANAYLGLRVGLTVSASIPAAVMAVAIFTLLGRRGTILEANISQTVGSASTSLATGTSPRRGRSARDLFAEYLTLEGIDDTRILRLFERLHDDVLAEVS